MNASNPTTETVSGVELPDAPYEIRQGIAKSAGAAISADQWLQSRGLRDCILKMQSPQADEYLLGFNEFRERWRATQNAARARGHRRGVLQAGLAAAGIAAGVLLFVLL